MYKFWPEEFTIDMSKQTFGLAYFIKATSENVHHTNCTPPPQMEDHQVDIYRYV